VDLDRLILFMLGHCTLGIALHNAHAFVYVLEGTIICVREGSEADITAR
jgi:hypothetical protein